MTAAVVVDPFSTGKLLAAAFRSRGVEPIAVLTQPIETHYSGATFVRKDFADVLVARPGEMDILVAAVRELQPLCVVPGCESGVELADLLCAALRLPGNDPAFAHCRRDKFHMQQQLACAGLRSVAQLLVQDPAQAVGWSRAIGRASVVVKPRRSAGSDNVWLCKSEEDLCRRIDEVLRATTILGEENRQALVQEYVEGVEYVVDAVSQHGAITVTNACRYIKESWGGAFLYREVHLLHPDSPEVGPILEYHGRVLQALGIRHGASHAEIMMTQTGPVLIECGARLHGGVTIPELVGACLGRSPVDLLVASYVDSADEFAQRARLPDTYSYGAVFVLANRREGRVESLEGVLRPRLLHCEHAAHINVCVGDWVRQTVDLYSSPGWIALQAPHPAMLARDLQELRTLEAQNRLICITSGA